MAITFIKLDIGIFSNPKIQRIDRMSGADSHFRIFIGILCMAMKSHVPGTLMISENLPADPGDIAKFCGKSEDQVREALAVFKRLGMVTLEDEILSVPSFNEHQRLDKIEKANASTRERMKKYREKQRLLLGVTRNDTGNDTVTLRNVTPTDLRLKTKDEDTRHKTEEKMGAVAPRPPASEVVESSTGKKPRAKKNSPQSVLFDRLVEMRRDSGTMPVSGQDERELFSHQARVMLAEIEKTDGAENAVAVFAWAFKDKFWGKMPVVPRNYLKYKTAMGQGPNGGADQFSRVMAMIEKDRQNGQV